MITGEFLLVEFIVESTRPGKLEATKLRRFTKAAEANEEFDRAKADPEVTVAALYKQTTAITRVKVR